MKKTLAQQSIVKDCPAFHGEEGVHGAIGEWRKDLGPTWRNDEEDIDNNCPTTSWNNHRVDFNVRM